MQCKCGHSLKEHGSKQGAAKKDKSILAGHCFGSEDYMLDGEEFSHFCECRQFVA